ncbi:hypothetical protein QWJ34_12090 [Saccharibacillus sp. CPCC 101409]|uniref:hypothetical protein n=1 Tax=Saccharibacillus sp. CPCC 101409 TaxID=3058041 RepID=UPI0026720CDE|nr:hypothetical protein [Saccharibacillus sp. CPCC 101409]MDO3410502.1 hypothetical protein [Saccharibacillus sp. CPCC 101409]
MEKLTARVEKLTARKVFETFGKLAQSTECEIDRRKIRIPDGFNGIKKACEAKSEDRKYLPDLSEKR